MRIAVFGSNGRVGSLVVAELLERGHHVTAFVHSASRLAKHPDLSLLRGDIKDPSIVKNTVKGSDAVISALGSWGTPEKNILSVGMQNIIPAMQSASIKRIVSLTGADARALGDQQNVINMVSHSLLNIMAGKILRDGEEHIRLLNDSGLDWTVVRSPVMNEHGIPTKYKLSLKRPTPWTTINRHAVALGMVDLLESDNYSGEAPFITRY